MFFSYSYATWKAAYLACNALPRMTLQRGMYRIWFYDGVDEHETILWTGEVPSTAGVDQAQNDASRADFEASVLGACNKIQPRNQDGLPRVVAEKPTSSRVTLYTPNWCDKTTWYAQSVRVDNEQPAVVDGAYTLAHTNVVDAGHGKITQEDLLRDGDGLDYRVHVTYQGVVQHEQDPHLASGGDFTLNYATGVMTPLTWTADAANTAVTYHYATSSLFSIKPTAGKRIILELAECQFATDLVLTDTVIFQPRGFVDAFAPQLLVANGGPYPPGTLIPLGPPFKYKTMWDYFNDSVKSYPAYPALGGGGWRGCVTPTLVFDWDYVRSTALLSSRGMQIDIHLEHEVPFGGTCATVSFYCATENE